MLQSMKTVTIRDLRQRWPETEKALQAEQEIVITRDGRPVARLLRVLEQKSERKRWDSGEHKKWLKNFWGNKLFPSADAALAHDRADRWEKDSD
jgi:antitoxin (DNA-binding transcriptional repressor) of toxin-antitoxin stability system